jgi:hypothetical protein
MRCFLSLMGRYEEGLPAARKAQTLDPLSVNSTHEVGYELLAMGGSTRPPRSSARPSNLNPNWIWGNISSA